MYLSKLLTALLIVPAASVLAAPAANAAAASSEVVARSADVNPFVGKNFFANSIYAKKLETTIKYFLKQKDLVNAARVRTIQKTGTFVWVSKFADIKNVQPTIREAWVAQQKTRKQQIVELVVYNLPDRDCSAKASDGELKLAEGGAAKYKQFVDQVAKELKSKKAKELTFAIVLEPDSLGNIVTNMAVEKCANAAQAYKDGVAYAISKLQLPNVHLYIDAAHGGWLGWNDNLAPSAELFAEVIGMAGNNATIRGFATNVSNYNAYIANPRENFTEWSNSWDEFHYADSLTPHLEANGVPAHFIIDQGRAGKLAIKTEWGQWCNIRNAGFGTRPTTQTGNPNVDALVWVKPGGESDGTSDPTSHRFDAMCASPVAHVPAPEAGEWFNDFVVNLIKNANPVVPPTWI